MFVFLVTYSCVKINNYYDNVKLFFIISFYRKINEHKN